RDQALAEPEVGDLIVVLEEGDEPVARDAADRTPARLALPRVELALIEEAALDRRHQLLRRPAVVVEVAVDDAGQRDPRGVVEVVVPQRVELAWRLEQRAVLGLVLADHEDRAA